MPVVGIVAGEASGDLLGSHLIHALKAQRPDLKFVGIAGPKMVAAGATALFPMEKLAVCGYFEVLRHLWEIVRIRKQLLAYFRKHSPALFIGIDTPDFNLGLEAGLKQSGITTVHYVSPTIWAWRRGRIRKIGRAVSHVLALFPFEVPLYEQAGIPATYIGHPLADMLPLTPDQAAAQRTLRLRPGQLVVAMLPGSRQSELDYMSELFIHTARMIYEQVPQVQFLVPMVSRETLWKFQAALHRLGADGLPLTLMYGHAHHAMEAADAVIVASGTATLEAALLKRPMVVVYRMSPLSWQIVRHLCYQPYAGLPNILAGREVVPELLQQQATPENITRTLLDMVQDKSRVAEIRAEFTRLHHLLRQNSAEKAVRAVLELLP